MGSGTANGAKVKNPGPTPKAILHQKYGKNVCYVIEEVLVSCENTCPGLAIQQSTRCLFKCHLELPELRVTSGAFPKKREAEQSAAELALEKLGIQPVTDSPTPEEAFNELTRRISYLFSDEFLSTPHPLTGHFRATLMREGGSVGFVPISVIVSYDSKTISLCRTIDAKSELNPFLMISHVLRAARSSSSVCILDGELLLGRKTPYPPEVVQALLDRYPSSTEHLQLEAVYIPSLVEKPVKPLILNISCDDYYLNEIASNLNVKDSSRVLLSRNIGKASSEMRLFFPAPESIYLSSYSSSDATNNGEEITVAEQPMNHRATFISGQKIQGNAIMALVTYRRNSLDLYHGHVPLCTFYRTILSKVPTGSYKLSREAILVAELPHGFTARLNWRGAFPRDLLCMFCRHHKLSEPVFTVQTGGSVQTCAESLETCGQTKPKCLAQNGDSRKASELVPSTTVFRCGVKIFSRTNNLIIECPPGITYQKQCDALQNAALKVLCWFNKFFEQNICKEKLSSLASSHGIYVKCETFLSDFQPCDGYLNGWNVDSVFWDKTNGKREPMVFSIIEDPDSGNPPSQGSLVCISYAVALLNEDDDFRENIESKDHFEFEVGSGAVISQLEACVSQMSLNQCANFILEVPSRDIILAAAGESAKHLSDQPLHFCKVEYSIKLIGITEQLEDRLEQALFSPPLSKQRVEFAVKYINESLATTLVDFGCGSGSLLDALLDQMTTLKKIVGVDISRKGLTRAAKVLHSKLSKKQLGIRSLELYDGSILDFDSRLYGCDIGTCLEVIEHMEEEQATAFGNVVLRAFCPKMLIISTPNYEYNVLLQRGNLSGREEDPDEKSESAPCKFRNHDHKFEWTRVQFERWASTLASGNGYSVEFSGVGGSRDDPGFASQIAVFEQLTTQIAVDSADVEESRPYEMIWQWQIEPMHPPTT